MTAMDPAPEVLVFMVDAGGGHRAAATALVAAAEEKGCPWRFRVVSLQTVLEPLDLLKRFTGLSMEGAYNLILRRRWTVLLRPLLRVLHLLIALRRRSIASALGTYLSGSRPLAVVSLVPNFNGVIRDAVHAVHPGVPFLVVLTDFADLPPHFWIEPGVDRVIAGSERAAAQAAGLGVPAHRVSLVSGMILHPRFYADGGARRGPGIREERGIRPDEFVVLLLFGGKGSAEMEPLARALLAVPAAIRVVALCGDNPRLLASLEPLAAASGGRLLPFGFTDRMADFLHAADVLVTKPGPGSLAEAFHQGVPVVVADNRHTIPQERWNARLVRDRALGIVVERLADVPATVADLARDPDRLRALRRNIAALPPNRAVYEVLELIEKDAALSATPAAKALPVEA
jgi:UDP-N-acetylglucosamine:LPS N-acetylglucosamine transferase